MIERQWTYGERVCACGELYRPISRDRGGPFHFRVMRITSGPDGKVTLMGHWRSGDWKPGELLELRRRDGHRLMVTDAEMMPAVNEATGIRGQRTLLATGHRSLQPQSCVRALAANDMIP
jgi:hypothetical protein